MGSSPRVWGQVARGEHQQVRYGIIPTRMGTRRQQDGYGYILQDHPHAYGDKQSHRLQHFQKPGSSPRVWGQGRGHTVVMAEDRIIPTRMGTSHF